MLCTHLRRLNNLILNIKINILINIIILQSRTIPSNLKKLINTSLVKVRRQVTLVFRQNLRLSLLTTETVAKGSFNGNFVEDGTVVQGDGKSVGDGTLCGVVVVDGELRVFDTLDALAEVFDKGRCSGFGAVGVVVCCETVEGEHGCDHVLDAVVAVGEVVHFLELLVDDADAGFVGAVGDFLDVLGALAEVGELLVDDLGGFDGGLGVEFGWGGLVGYLG